MQPGLSLPPDIKAAVAAIGRIDAVPLILEVICRTTGMGFAAVARVTQDRWVACRVRDEIAFGLEPGGELQVATTICDQIRETGEAVVIDHVAQSVTYRQHPTPALYGFQSYISVPIRRSDGSFFGTLCAIDPRPAQLDKPEITGMFKLFAELIAVQLDAQDRIDQSETALSVERETSELREHFIAVLGHDLRNPLAAVDAGARYLAKQSFDQKSTTIVRLMQTSIKRMAGLIDNVLDFARGHLGGGLSLDVMSSAPLLATLEQVAAELRTVSPDRRIDTHFDIAEPVECDSTRIAQLFSNLLANAITHGAAEGAITVHAVAQGGWFELMVANPGVAISEDAMGKLFQPFYGTSLRLSQNGLGLGLYIASIIAKAHGGRLDVASSNVETRFTFVMPTSRIVA